MAPYTTAEDSRFDWLQNTSLAYLDAWYETTQARPGSFSDDHRSRMLLSQQTYKGLKTTVSSLIDVVKFLISEGMEFVLSERFCQDLLEEYFGRQRERGRFSDINFRYRFSQRCMADSDFNCPKYMCISFCVYKCFFSPIYIVCSKLYLGLSLKMALAETGFCPPYVKLYCKTYFVKLSGLQPNEPNII